MAQMPHRPQSRLTFHHGRRDARDLDDLALTRLDLFGSRMTDFGVRLCGTSLRHIEMCGGGLTDEGVGF